MQVVIGAAVLRLAPLVECTLEADLGFLGKGAVLCSMRLSAVLRLRLLALLVVSRGRFPECGLLASGVSELVLSVLLRTVLPRHAHTGGEGAKRCLHRTAK